MRLLAVEACGPFARQLTEDDAHQMLLPVVKRVAEVNFFLFSFFFFVYCFVSVPETRGRSKMVWVLWRTGELYIDGL